LETHFCIMQGSLLLLEHGTSLGRFLGSIELELDQIVEIRILSMKEQIEEI